MLKRLIIAILALSLVLAFSGTAISGDGRISDLSPVVKIDPTNARFNDISQAGPEQPTFKKPESALKEIAMPGGVPSIGDRGYFCDNFYYYDDTATSVYYWTIPDAYGDDLFNTRFTVGEQAICTLKTAWILMLGAVMEGTPDMRVYLWDDDGFGLPGNVIDSVDIPNASLPTGGFGWVSADFSASNYVFYQNEEYHYGWTNLGGPGDVLACVSDKATGPHDGEQRSSENWNGFWGSMLNDWGADYVFIMESETCCENLEYSDCYTQSQYGAPTYYWMAPHPVYGDYSYTQRVDIGGFDTLYAIDVFVYDPGDGSFGNDDVIIELLEADAGLPGAVTATYTFAAGTYGAYPTPISISFGGTIVTEDFFVAFSSSGTVDYESILSDDGSNGIGASFSIWDAGTGWVDMFTGWGADVNFVQDVYICPDYYSECAWLDYSAGLNWYWRLPDAYGNFAEAQKFIVPASALSCRPQLVDIAFYNNGDPDIYTTDCKVAIYDDVAGYPGTEQASIMLTPADYVLYPGLTEVDFTSFQIDMPGDYWVVVEAQTTDVALGVRTLSDDGGGGQFFGMAQYGDYFDPGNPEWMYMSDFWVAEDDQAMWAFTQHCCAPVPEWDCFGGGEEWATINHDQTRIGHSQNSLGDAYADLSLVWHFEHPTSGVSFTSPILSGGAIVCSFGSEYIAFDAASGTQLYSITGTPVGASVRCAPTVANIGGTDLMFVSGGNNGKVACYDFLSGAPVWNYTDLAGGQTRWGVFNILNVGGTDLVIWGTDGGRVTAAEAATGTQVWSVDLGASTFISGATNGTYLFYATAAIGGIDGDVFALNPADGNIAWQLSTDGLVAANLWPDDEVTSEYFTGGLAVHGGEVYVNSRVGTGGHPSDGVFYRINAANGARLSAARSERVIYGTPIVDANAVYVTCLSRWLGGTQSGHVLAFGRVTGTLKRAENHPWADGYYTSGALSCEPDATADLLINFDRKGMLHFINAETFEEVFRRRIDNGGGSSDIGQGVIIGPNGDVAAADFWGNLFYLKRGDLRQRLEVQAFSPELPVEFGTNGNFPVTVPGVFQNTGGADLTFGVIEVSDASFGFVIPEPVVRNVSTDMMERAGSIADWLTDETFRVKHVRSNETFEEASMESVRDRSRDEGRNFAAAAPPAFFGAITQPLPGHVLAAGDALDLVFTVDQNLIVRGLQTVYLLVNTDDPDYFLNHAARGNAPEMVIRLVGGCLLDTTHLAFGMGEANLQAVFNAGRIADGDQDPFGFEIDGFQDGFWQGCYVYGVSQYRIAMNSQAWHGGGQSESWSSLLPDPNFCDDGCKAVLYTDVALCAPVSRDGGQTYTEIRGNMVCRSYIDSVQNFDDGAGLWVWSDYGAPYDDTLTMGLKIDSRVLGAVDVQELANMTVDIMNVSTRYGQAVPNWKMGAFMDCDIYQTAGGTADTAYIDPIASIGWASTVGQTGYAWGFIKVPFGCGYAPLKNVYSADAAQGPWHDDDILWDSAYYYMSLPAGADGHDMTGAADMGFWATFAENDFAAGGDSYKFAVASFGYNNLVDGRTSDEFAYNAHFLNKWLGFGRGDVNDDNMVNLADIIRIAEIVNGGSGGAVPFEHLADVNADGAIDGTDVQYMIDFYFTPGCGGACPLGTWCF